MIAWLVFASTATALAEPIRSDSEPARAAPDSIGSAAELPFASNELPSPYPALGVSIGVCGYLASFTRVEQAFHTMESVYDTAGYPLPAASGVNLGAMLLSTVTVRLNPRVDVALQVGRADHESNRLRLTGGLVSGRYDLAGNPRYSLFAGLGGGTYGFQFKRSYGTPVTPVDANGGYYELAHIILKGGGGYWTAAGGFTFRPGPDTALEATIQYFGMGDVSTDTPRAGNVGLNASGTLLGVSFLGFF